MKPWVLLKCYLIKELGIVNLIFNDCPKRLSVVAIKAEDVMAILGVSNALDEDPDGFDEALVTSKMLPGLQEECTRLDWTALTSCSLDYTRCT